QEHSHNDTCFKKLKMAMARLSPTERDELCRFNLPAQLYAESTMEDDGAIHAKRTNALMGGYNETSSGSMQCNTDAKFVGSGWVGMALSVYMSSYTAKATMESAVVLVALAAAVEAAELKGAEITDETEQSRLVLRRTLNIMVGRRELSGQQVAAALLGHGTHRTNESFDRYYWSSVLQMANPRIFPTRASTSDSERYARCRRVRMN
ncbi:hypothetical protein CYLTODRAFT_360257, partial [Cylindrobasidium torrendii FP15055 ss-10]